MENNLEQRATILGTSARGASGIVELSRELGMSPAKLRRIMTSLQDEGFITLHEIRTGKAGRPKVIPDVTSLGREFLRAFESLESKKLRSRRSDLLRAAADGAYASRLESRGTQLYEIFLELNSIAFGIRKHAF